MGLRYTNPILPGWNSDPSCVFVPERNNTFFCVTSSFNVFPGHPIYASRDLRNWKHASNALNRPEQVPYFNDTPNQQAGLFASTLRYHDGEFYMITTFVAGQHGTTLYVLLLRCTDPYDDASWGNPILIDVPGFDPDIFWDDDGKSYITLSCDWQINSYQIDTETGKIGPCHFLWAGSGGLYAEGPHLYKKDGHYYLLLAEGGTELGHCATIARADHIFGPYEGCPNNPILTNRNTTQYFQTVGHADLFQDGSGNWWGVALVTRSGPSWKNYPMGRETALFPMTWRTREWPILQPVRGWMTGWHLPTAKDIPGRGQYVGEDDEIDFEPGSRIPLHFVHWRLPEPIFAVSPPGHSNKLVLKSSRNNLTGLTVFGKECSVALIMRRQAHTLFLYSLDVSFEPAVIDEEAGITIFLTQLQHIDLGLVMLPLGRDDSRLNLHVRFRTTWVNNPFSVPPTKIIPVPESWQGNPIRLEVESISEEKYVLAAASAAAPMEKILVGEASSIIVSGDTGNYTGALIGAYATSNGGLGGTPVYFSRWQYRGQGQVVGIDGETLRL